MSSMAEWAYKDPITGEDFKITVRPFIKYDDNGKAVYGGKFEIRGYMMGKISQVVSEAGLEIFSTRKYLTDSNKVKLNDIVGGKRVVYIEPINSLPLLGEPNIDWWVYTE